MGAEGQGNPTAVEEVLFTAVGLIQAFIAEGFVHVVGLPGWCDLDFRAVVNEVLEKCSVGCTGNLPGWDYYGDNGADHWILVMPDGNMTRKDSHDTHA